MAKSEDKTEKIYTLLLEMDQKMATKEDLKRFATKADMRAAIDGAKEELLEVINPMSKAVDRDAETIVKHSKQLTDHEVRLSALERKGAAA